MSNAKVCNNCLATLLVDERGDDPDGEIAGWVELSIGRGKFTWDACTRACAHELLDGVIQSVGDEYASAVAEIARAIRQEGELLVAGPCQHCGERLLHCLSALDEPEPGVIIYATECGRCGEPGNDVALAEEADEL